MAVSYLLKKMPGTYGISKRVLNELKQRAPTLNPQNILDFGAGLGSASIACNEIF